MLLLQQLNAHVAVPLALVVRRQLLANLRVGVTDDLGPAQQKLPHVFVRHLLHTLLNRLIHQVGQPPEEGIVEVDNMLTAAVVPVQVAHFGLVVGHVVLYFLQQQLPVAAPPAVDRLFHVAHHQVTVSGVQAVFYQRAKVGPL